MAFIGMKVQRGTALCVLYNAVNALLLLVFLKDALVVRSDGGAGFGEFALKGLFALLAIALFIAGLAISVAVRFQEKTDGGLVGACMTPTALLIVLAALAILEMCTDDGGHCRNWQIFLS